MVRKIRLITSRFSSATEVGQGSRELGDVRHRLPESIHGPGPFEYREIANMRRARQAHPLADRGLILP